MTRSHHAGLLALFGLLAGCSPMASGTAPSTLPAIAGQVEFVPAWQTSASIGEVANGATVSLIDPATGNTLATTLTGPTGEFLLNFGSSFRPGTAPYFIEASKGLALGGSPNRAGAPLVRLRSLIALQAGSWRSLTAGGFNINRGTTALSALSNLKGLNQAQNLTLLDTIRAGASTVEGITAQQTFTPTAGISDVEFQRAWDLVDRALNQNADPIAALFTHSGSNTSLGEGLSSYPGLAMSTDGWKLSSLSPSNGLVGATLTLYGHGLPTSTTGIRLTLNGRSCSVTSASASGTSLTFTIPAGSTAGTFPLNVSYGPWTDSSLTVTVN